MKEKCQGIIGFIFGHKFEDIYDQKIEYQALDKPSQEAWAHIVLNHSAPLLKREDIYVKSVCQRCGEEIKRDNKEKK